MNLLPKSGRISVNNSPIFNLKKKNNFGIYKSVGIKKVNRNAISVIQSALKLTHWLVKIGLNYGKKKKRKNEDKKGKKNEKHN